MMNWMQVQHESEYLWKNYHSFHHSIGTPSPVSTLYIDEVDATLQGSLPIMFACLIIRPHPVTYSIFAGLRVAENVINHTGLDSSLMNILTLKCLPLRASIAHHDAHHRFSNYSRNAKNYAESFWVFDWMFGTLSDTAKLRKHS